MLTEDCIVYTVTVLLRGSEDAGFDRKDGTSLPAFKHVRHLPVMLFTLGAEKCWSLASAMERVFLSLFRLRWLPCRFGFTEKVEPAVKG